MEHQVEEDLQKERFHLNFSKKGNDISHMEYNKLTRGSVLNSGENESDLI